MSEIDTIRRQISLHEEVSHDTPLKPEGKDWSGLCPIHKEKTPSFSVFTGKDGVERFNCFGCGAKGDVIDYVMLTRGLSKKDAIHALSHHEDIGKARPQREAVKSVYDDITPLPLGDWAIAPDREVTIFNPKKGKFQKVTPIAAHRYECGYVLRNEMHGTKRKWTPAVMRCRLASGIETWCIYSFPDPRPLYGTVSDRVIVVEGEKCADALAAIAKGYTVVTWAGGVEVVTKTDWTPLRGCEEVIIWPDADKPGVDAALKIVAAIGQGRILDVATHSSGWDVADAIVDGWKWPDIEKFINPQHVYTLESQEKMPEDEFAWVGTVKWERGNQLVVLPGCGVPLELNPKSLTNAYNMLKCHPDTAGLLLYDVFEDSVVVTRTPPWDKFEDRQIIRKLVPDEDCVGFRMWLENFYFKITKSDAKDILVKVATENEVNPPMKYFETLQWDGVPRLDTWLNYYLGVAQSEYSRFVGRKWLAAAVARVYEPGCKFDTALILEGAQYLGKSRALAILATIGGKRYFTDESVDFHSKDSIMICQGNLIVEMAELASWSRADSNEIKAFITRQQDSYRPPYGMSVKHRPRMFVLAGTVNPSGGYMSDATGNRRYWPVKCTAIDNEALEADKEMLWAEAVEVYKSKERLYLLEEEYAAAQIEQEGRYSEDALADDVDRAVDYIEMEFGLVTPGVKVNEIFEFLKITADKKSNQMMARIKSHLTYRGFEERRIDRDGKKERRWVRKSVDSCPEGM